VIHVRCNGAVYHLTDSDVDNQPADPAFCGARSVGGVWYHQFRLEVDLPVCKKCQRKVGR
jgi:hypothetical protein